jgi:hypothetical protein
LGAIVIVIDIGVMMIATIWEIWIWVIWVIWVSWVQYQLDLFALGACFEESAKRGWWLDEERVVLYAVFKD